MTFAVRATYWVLAYLGIVHAVEHALVGLGVPDERVHTERFDMV